MAARSQKTSPNEEAVVGSEMHWFSLVKVTLECISTHVFTMAKHVKHACDHFLVFGPDWTSHHNQTNAPTWHMKQYINIISERHMHTTDVKNARAYACVRVRTRSHVFVGVRMSSTKNNVFRGTQIKHKWPSSSCGLVWAYACPATKTAFPEERKSHHRNNMQTRRRQRKRYECKETYNNNNNTKRTSPQTRE